MAKIMTKMYRGLTMITCLFCKLEKLEDISLSKSDTTQMKAIEQYFPLTCGSVYYATQGGFHIAYR